MKMINGVQESILINWIRNSQSIGAKQKNDLLADIFCTYLESIIKNGWRGACHDSSAALYMTLSEYGFMPELCIGVVGNIKGDFIGHSWIEINGEIYDAAICYPNLGGTNISPPIFSSYNVESLIKTDIIYGLPKQELGLIEKQIAKATLEEYANMRPTNHHDLWSIAANIGSAVPNGRKLDKNIIKMRYNKIKRILRNN
jgi:hypothetical protein